MSSDRRAGREGHGHRSEYEHAPRHPRCFDEATKGDCFWAYVTDSLSPVLKPGDTVIPNDHGAHKVVGKRDGVQTAGVQLLLRFTALSLQIIHQLKIVSITQS
ncbi:hypothetical protein Mext_0046 [Methylorubrum extorquens PA1]|nr:hypothetical protein Mext_0046 [Methylorubrum extorquens PA1]